MADKFKGNDRLRHMIDRKNIVCGELRELERKVKDLQWERENLQWMIDDAIATCLSEMTNQPDV